MMQSKLFAVVTTIACLLGSALGVIADMQTSPLPIAPSSKSVLMVPPSPSCELRGPLYPRPDGLPSADYLFSGFRSFYQQVFRLKSVVQVDSVCYDDLGPIGEDGRWESFDTLQKTLKFLYPKLHSSARVDLEYINTYGLVYTIQGSEEKDKKPILFTAHQDVVPIGDELEWEYKPFSGHFDGNWMWGRGVGDDKNRLTAIMTVFETLLSRSPFWAPHRTVVIALGFDEECSGLRGAAHIKEHLLDRYGDDGFAAVIDEGGLGMVELGKSIYALPAVQEKGFVNIWVDLQVRGGHSSVPTPNTGIGIMSQIAVALEENPYQPEIIAESPIHRSLICLAEHSPDAFPALTELVNDNDLETLSQVVGDLSLSTRALIQTTQALDVIHGGDKINSLPEYVTLGVNYRVAPQDNILDIQNNVAEYILPIVNKFNLTVSAFQDDKDYQAYVAKHGDKHFRAPQKGDDYAGTLTIKASKKFNGAPASPNGQAWRTFAGTIESTFAQKGSKVIPTGVIMTGNTDSKHFLELSRNIFRWNPHLATDVKNLHAVNERLRMSAHIGVVKFYYNLFRNFDQDQHSDALPDSGSDEL